MSDSKTAHLVLIRHCETMWNAEHKLQGQVDIPLNVRGREQAQSLARELSDETFHGIYASHLSRAHETASIIAAHHPHEVITDQDLQEGFYGEAEGIHIDVYHEKYKEAKAVYDQLPREEKLKGTIVPDAETRVAIIKRVSSALYRLSEKHLGERILVVTHGGVLRSLLMFLSEEFTDPPFVHNGAKVHLLCDGKSLCFHSLEQPIAFH